MKKYLLFAGDTYYPAGGAGDFEGSFTTIEQARSKAKELEEVGSGYRWWHIAIIVGEEFIIAEERDT